jgi:hypothetical protein
MNFLSEPPYPGGWNDEGAFWATIRDVQIRDSSSPRSASRIESFHFCGRARLTMPIGRERCDTTDYTTVLSLSIKCGVLYFKAVVMRTVPYTAWYLVLEGTTWK